MTIDKKLPLHEKVQTGAKIKKKGKFKKTGEANIEKLLDIPFLVDAEYAGGEFFERCTLILTERESAKVIQRTGFFDHKYLGVFPLGCKLPNVREASNVQVMENVEINNIIQILGLQLGKVYNSISSLRYGHLMIMTNQDYHGCEFKGLLINLIHLFWPSLLKIPNFLGEYIIPIVKATHGDEHVLWFYNLPEYESWKESFGDGKANDWSIKYYERLASRTTIEALEYFLSLKTHLKYFTWVDERDGDAIDMAFSNKKIEARMTWLQQYEPETFLDRKEKYIKYIDFVNKELILYFWANLQRSTPSMVDGLTHGQRKILCCALEHNLVTEINVGQFSYYVSEKFGYHPREHTRNIVGMAQNFVGSNNINLFNLRGHVGTRYQGCNYNACAKYSFTNLTPIARFMFPKDDDILLDYLNENGRRIEPTWYAPVIPLVLVNGSKGSGTGGCNTFVPNYNPRDLSASVRRILRGKRMVSIHPWYNGFEGTIVNTTIKKSGTSYTLSGILNEKDELYRTIADLPTTINTNNMFLFDQNGVIKKYDNIEQIVEEFVKVRLDLYQKRLDMLLKDLPLEISKLSNTKKFISSMLKGEINFTDFIGEDAIVKLQEKVGFANFQKNEESSQVSIDFRKHLLSMGPINFSEEKVMELDSQIDNLTLQLKKLVDSDAKTLWINDLDVLDQELDAIAVDKKKLKGKVMNEAAPDSSSMELDVLDQELDAIAVDRKKLKGKVMNEAAPDSSSMEMAMKEAGKVQSRDAAQKQPATTKVVAAPTGAKKGGRAVETLAFGKTRRKRFAMKPD